jgi:hypothetical protein
LVFALFLLWAGSSCSTIHQPLVTQDVALRGGGDLPATIGIVEETSLAFDYPPGSSECLFVEDLNPGLTDTLQGAFSYVFRGVSVVQSGDSEPHVDVVAYPSLELTDPLKLTITFTDPHSGRYLAIVSAQRPLDFDPASGAYAYLARDVMLFATAVVIPPLDPWIGRTIKRHEAERFNARFDPAIAQMVGEIALRASVDPALRSFAANLHQVHP